MQTQDTPLKKKPYGASRVAAIDAARGATMLFVCLAHFADSYQFTSGADASGGYLVIMGMIASPTFVTVSGMVAGFLAVTRASTFDALCYKLFDRGLFLLVVGHTILAASALAIGRDFATSFKIGYITDAIGFSVMLGPWLVAKLSARTRLGIAVTTFVLSWIAIFAWEPSAALGVIAKRYLIGEPNSVDWSSGNFPLIPWFAVYVAGTVIGARIGKFYRDQQLRDGNVFLAKVGASIFVLGAGGKVAFAIIRHSMPAFLTTYRNIAPLLSSYQKFPPGPVYIAFFGGAGMLLVATVLEVSRRGLLPWVLGQLRQIGLASLFVYVLQFYVYVVIIRSLKLPYTVWWPALFAISIVFLTLAAAAWNRREGNRFLTVGIGPYIDWRAKRRASKTGGRPTIDAAPVDPRPLAHEPIATRGVA
jgi:uncharacterized membrane protein